MIVILNPNSSAQMTASMLDTARRTAPNCQIEAWTSHDGPPSIQGAEDGAACLPPLLDLVRKAAGLGPRAIVIGCFDDTGLQEARAIANCPVIGIGQAAYHLAAMLGPRFSVVTTLSASIPILEANIRSYGLGGQLASVRASGVPVLDLETDRDRCYPMVLAEAELAARNDGVQSVVLGCGGMSGLPEFAGNRLSVPLIDGVRVAVRMAGLL